jgi:hypothetical protein
MSLLYRFIVKANGLSQAAKMGPLKFGIFGESTIPGFNLAVDLPSNAPPHFLRTEAPIYTERTTMRHLVFTFPCSTTVPHPKVFPLAAPILVNDVCVHPNQGELISCDQAGSIKQWDLSENLCSHELVSQIYDSFKVESLQFFHVFSRKIKS